VPSTVRKSTCVLSSAVSHLQHLTHALYIFYRYVHGLVFTYNCSTRILPGRCLHIKKGRVIVIAFHHASNQKTSSHDDFISLYRYYGHNKIILIYWRHFTYRCIYIIRTQFNIILTQCVPFYIKILYNI